MSSSQRGLWLYKAEQLRTAVCCTLLGAEQPCVFTVLWGLCTVFAVLTQAASLLRASCCHWAHLASWQPSSASHSIFLLSDSLSPASPCTHSAGFVTNTATVPDSQSTPCPVIPLLGWVLCFCPLEPPTLGTGVDPALGSVEGWSGTAVRSVRLKSCLQWKQLLLTRKRAFHYFLPIFSLPLHSLMMKALKCGCRVIISKNEN